MQCEAAAQPNTQNPYLTISSSGQGGRYRRLNKMPFAGIANSLALSPAVNQKTADGFGLPRIVILKLRSVHHPNFSKRRTFIKDDLLLLWGRQKNDRIRYCRG
jgi:hypothetical protein